MGMLGFCGSFIPAVHSWRFSPLSIRISSKSQHSATPAAPQRVPSPAGGRRCRPDPAPRGDVRWLPGYKALFQPQSVGARLGGCWYPGARPQHPPNSRNPPLYGRLWVRQDQRRDRVPGMGCGFPTRELNFSTMSLEPLEPRILLLQSLRVLPVPSLRRNRGESSRWLRCRGKMWWEPSVPLGWGRASPGAQSLQTNTATGSSAERFVEPRARPRLALHPATLATTPMVPTFSPATTLFLLVFLK